MIQISKNDTDLKKLMFKIQWFIKWRFQDFAPSVWDLEIPEICEICEIREISEISEIREIYEIYGICEIYEICEVITTLLQPISYI